MFCILQRNLNFQSTIKKKVKILNDKGVWKYSPTERLKNVLNSECDIIYEPQLGYCVRIQVYTCTVSHLYWKLQRKYKNLS